MIGTLATAQSSRHGGMENTEKPPLLQSRHNAVPLCVPFGKRKNLCL